eukprot:TRINITY_DN44108_c0_g1_i1.p1 TRINITY_DN44108_c0_g1~~TRINITY_DN44108_c0_g1_i1.p1  ORF type:complete len:1118 (+),score=304.92 TRINITY_DN44108_c0_g1_i1:58-3411(+)
MNVEQVRSVLQTLLGVDNTVRAAAEKSAAEWADRAPAEFYNSLLSHLDALSTEESQMACTLMRKHHASILRPEHAVHLEAVKSALLTSLASRNHVHAVATALGTVVCAFARELLTAESNRWPEILPWLFAAGNGAPPAVQSTAFEVLGSLSSSAYSILTPHTPNLVNLLSWAFQSHATGRDAAAVRMAAAACLHDVVSVHTPASGTPATAAKAIAPFQPLCLPMLNAIGRALQDGFTEEAMQGLEALISVAEVAPEFFAGDALLRTLEAMMQLAGMFAIEARVRHMAVECLVTLSESLDRRVRKVEWFAPAFYAILFRMLCAVPPGEEWAVSAASDEAEEDDPSAYNVAYGALSRFAVAVGGRALGPAASRMFVAFHNAPDTQVDAEPPADLQVSSLEEPTYGYIAGWRLRCAALVSLAQIVEGCSKPFAPHLGVVTSRVLQRLSDSNRRVRHAALMCLTELCNEFSPDFQNCFAAQVVPAVIAVLMPPTNDAGDPNGMCPPRVQETACHVLNNLILDLSKEHSDSALVEQVVLSLLRTLQALQPFVRLAALTAIASVAEHCGEGFERFYHMIHKYLLGMLEARPTTADERMLRAKAFEAVSVVGMAMGPKYAPFAEEVMQKLATALPEDAASDDPQVTPWMEAVGRLARLLKHEFVPVLPVVFPRLLKYAEEKEEVFVTEDEDQLTTKAGYETLVCQSQDQKEQNVQVHTSMMHDKSCAVAAIGEIISVIPEAAVLPHVVGLVNLMIPLITYPYLDDIRIPATRAAVPLVKVVMSTGDMEWASKLVNAALKEILEAIDGETEARVLVEFIDAFGSILGAGPPDVMPADALNQYATEMLAVLKDALNRHTQINTAEREEEEEEEAKHAADHERDLAKAVNESVGMLLKTHAAFRPTFVRDFLPFYEGLLKGADVVGIHIGLCALDDFVEMVAPADPAAVLPFAQPVLAAILHYTPHPDLLVRQAAAYGLGIYAANLPDAFAQSGSAPAAVEALRRVVAESSQHDPAVYASVSSNALSALLRINHAVGRTCPEAADAVVMPLLLAHLPIEGDAMEARFVHGRLVALASQGHPAVAGAGGENLPVLARALVPVADSPLVDEETKRALSALAAAVQPQQA